MAPGFGDVRQYVGGLIFMRKVKSKIRFDFLLRGGGGFLKNVAVTDFFRSKIDLRKAP